MNAISLRPTGTEEICKSSREVKTVECTNEINLNAITWRVSTIQITDEICTTTVRESNTLPIHLCNDSLGQGVLLINRSSDPSGNFSLTLDISINQIPKELNHTALIITCANSIEGESSNYTLNLIQGVPEYVLGITYKYCITHITYGYSYSYNNKYIINISFYVSISL